MATEARGKIRHHSDMLRRNLYISSPNGTCILQQPIHKKRVELGSENAIEVKRGARHARQDKSQREYRQKAITDAKRRRAPKVIKLCERDAGFGILERRVGCHPHWVQTALIARLRRPERISLLTECSHFRRKFADGEAVRV